MLYYCVWVFPDFSREIFSKIAAGLHVVAYRLGHVVGWRGGLSKALELGLGSIKSCLLFADFIAVGLVPFSHCPASFFRYGVFVTLDELSQVVVDVLARS
jgi:hypothetical protein